MASQVSMLEEEEEVSEGMKESVRVGRQVVRFTATLIDLMGK